jgi:Fe2+ transport system protein FeoA
MNLKMKLNTNYIITAVNSPDASIRQRLQDLGLYPGVTIKVLNILSFKSVFILQFGESIIALNKSEMSCLIY